MVNYLEWRYGKFDDCVKAGKVREMQRVRDLSAGGVLRRGDGDRETFSAADTRNGRSVRTSELHAAYLVVSSRRLLGENDLPFVNIAMVFVVVCINDFN